MRKCEVFLVLMVVTFILPVAVVAETNEETNETETRILPPIRHYRAGSGEPIGFSQQAKEELISAYKPSPQAMLELRSKLPKILSETREKFKKLYENPRDRIMPCVEDKANVTKLDKSVGADSNVILTDYLFVPRDMLPADPYQAFGRRVMMFVYDFDDPKSPVPDIARGLGVKCVPFRLRGSIGQITRYEGKTALKNFEEDAPAKPLRNVSGQLKPTNRGGQL